MIRFSQHKGASMKGKVTTIVAAMLAAGAFSSGAMAALNSAQPDLATSSHDPSVDAPMITSLPYDQAEAFSILSTPREKGDNPGTGPKGPFGANLALARKVNTVAGPAWLVPANGHLCLRATDSVGAVWTCTTTALAKSGGLIMTIRPEDPQAPAEAIYAAIPDDVAHVQLSGPTESRDVAVMGNVAAVTDSAATTLTVTDAEGGVRGQDVPR